MNVEDAKLVLDWLSAYRKGVGEGNALQPQTFGQWLSTQTPESEEQVQQGPPVDGIVSMYLGFIANYAAFYARRIFRHTAIYSMTDWAFLATLAQEGEMNKSALIQHNIMEKSSGTEVLKRLLKQGFTEERADPDDRRAKRVRLTKAGATAVESVNTMISNMGQVVTGELSPAEKQRLLALLQKLHRFHEPIFQDHSEEQLAELLGLPGKEV